MSRRSYWPGCNWGCPPEGHADGEYCRAAPEPARVTAPVDQADEQDAATALANQYLAALVDTKALDQIPEPEPLIRGVMFLDSLVWLAGRKGNGKSFVGIDMAGCVGSEPTWQGYPVRNGPVLYVAAEGVRGIRWRVRAWEQAMGHAMTNVQFFPRPVQASNATAWRALITVATKLAVVLVVIDTQARVTVGMEENSSKDMGQFVERLDELRRATGATVMTVHHAGRNGEHMRGASALDAGADTIVMVEKSGDTITLSTDEDKGGKQKDQPEFDPIYLRLVPMGDSAVLTATDRPQGTATDSRAVRDMLGRWWQSFGSEPQSVRVLVVAEVCTERTFHRAKKALLSAGVIIAEGKGRAVRYHMVKEPDA